MIRKLILDSDFARLRQNTIRATPYFGAVGVGGVIVHEAIKSDFAFDSRELETLVHPF